MSTFPLKETRKQKLGDALTRTGGLGEKNTSNDLELKRYGLRDLSFLRSTTSAAFFTKLSFTTKV